MLVIIAPLLAVVPGRVSHAQQEGYLIFDLGQDGTAINIPGLTFTDNTNDTWLYGDVRTRQYNAPFPESCADRPEAIARPVCEFAVAGTGFAWVGQLGREGTITFTQGTASYVEASFSTGATLQVVANDSLGRPIDAVAVTANIGTGQLERVRLEATADRRIASIIIRGSPNFWLLDNLATDAPGVPDQRPPAEESASPFTFVTQHASPNTNVRPGGIVTYTIVATNHGEGDAENVQMTMPVNPAHVQVLDARFSHEEAWVSAVLSDTLVIETGRIASNGGVMTATVRLAIHSNVAIGTPLGARLIVTGDGVDAERKRSNQTLLVVGDANNQQPFYPLTTDPVVGPVGSTHSFSSTIFVPGEPVTLWYSSPTGDSVEITMVNADENGAINVEFMTQNLATGAYSMVAYGNWSTLTAVGTFEVTDSGT
jgi:hypothetical protein